MPDNPRVKVVYVELVGGPLDGEQQFLPWPFPRRLFALRPTAQGDGVTMWGHYARRTGVRGTVLSVDATYVTTEEGRAFVREAAQGSPAMPYDWREAP